MAWWAWWRVAAVVAVVVVVAPPPAAPCSCHLLHPQQHVCEADFVVFARVRRLTTSPDGRQAYKVRVKRMVKGSEKADLMLQKGLLYTLPNTCHAQLINRTSYVISGSVSSGKPLVTLCDFASPVRSLTSKMKKGFRLLYQSGCDCSIMSCHLHHFGSCPRAPHYCSWTTSLRKSDCQGRQSMCLRGPSGECEWLQGRLYRRCMKTQLQPRNATGIPPLPYRNTIRRRPPGVHRGRIPKYTYKRRPGFRRWFRRRRPRIGYTRTKLKEGKYTTTS